MKKRKFNPITNAISLCPNCYCMTYDIIGSDGIFCGKCKMHKNGSSNVAQNDTSNTKNDNLHRNPIAQNQDSQKTGGTKNGN